MIKDILYWDYIKKVSSNLESRMPREKCNNNPEDTCSSGLHFCSKEYLANFIARSPTNY